MFSAKHEKNTDYIAVDASFKYFESILLYKGIRQEQPATLLIKPTPDDGVSYLCQRFVADAQ